MITILPLSHTQTLPLSKTIIFQTPNPEPSSMAKNSKPLNPMAPPYLKLPSTQFPHPTPPLISHNNVHDYYQPHRSNYALTPVPSGPRIPTSRLPGRRRKPNKATGTVGFDGSKRWKNRRGDYYKTLPLEEKTTTLMIKNIPNKLTKELMIQVLDNHCKCENQKMDGEFISAYDYFYLPIDFKSGANAGFAFVNFTNPKAALRFRDAFHGKHWEFHDSRKVAEISRAKIQGKKAIINHFKTSRFGCASVEDLPAVFEPARDGSGGINSQVIKLGKLLTE